MFTSEALTRGIRVRVVSAYVPERSRPSAKQWFFHYTITISNEGSEIVQLRTRHWIITDGKRHTQGFAAKRDTKLRVYASGFLSSKALRIPLGTNPPFSIACSTLIDQLKLRFRRYT